MTTVKYAQRLKQLTVVAALTAVAGTSSAFAQPKKPLIKPKVFELGGKKPAAGATKSKVNGKKEPKVEPQRAGGLTRGRGGFAMQPRRWAVRLERVAINLDRAAAEAFSRGLMPMRDYAVQLRSVEQLLTAAADLRKSKTRKLYALNAHARRLAEAAAKLKALNQPAAKGTKAEIALANYLTAQTRDRSIALRRGTNRLGAGTTAAAAKYFKQIKEDHGIGLADDRQLSDAAVYSALSVGSDASQQVAAWRTVADAVARRAKTLENIPGDRFAVTLAHLKAVEHLAAAEVALGGGRKADADRHLLKSAGYRGEEFKMLRDRIRTGTASLFELARAWNARREAADRLAQIDKPTERSLASDLETLNKLANAVEDRRGRNAADVLFVNALREIRHLPAGSTTSAAGTPRRTRPRIQPQVIDLKPRTRLRR